MGGGLETLSSAERGRRGDRVALAAMLAVAALLYFFELGRSDLRADEFLHAVAARSWLADGSLGLPSGNSYERAWAYTVSVALSFATFGASQWAARLPSALLGLATVAAVFGLTRVWFGSTAARTAALATATAPLLVDTFRMSRMYAAFVLVYCVAVFAAERAWSASPARADGSPPGKAFGSDRSAWSAAAAWTSCAVGSWLLAYHFQLLALDALAATAVCVLAAAVLARGRAALAVVAGAVLALALVVAFPDGFSELLARARSSPRWLASHRQDWSFHLLDWARSAPWLALAFPLAVLWLPRRYGAVGFFVVLQVVVPLALHSFLFAQKAPRYVVHLLPLAFVAAAPVLVALGERSFDLVAGRRAGALRFRPVVVGLVLVCAVVGPSARQLLHEVENVGPGWSRGLAFVSSRLGEGDALVVSLPLAAAFYPSARPTHVLNNFRLDTSKTLERSPDGDPIDWYSGLPMITDGPSFARVRQAHPRGWVLADRRRLSNTDAVPRAVQSQLAKHCTPLVGGVRVYLYLCSWGVDHSKDRGAFARFLVESGDR